MVEHQPKELEVFPSQTHWEKSELNKRFFRIFIFIALNDLIERTKRKSLEINDPYRLKINNDSKDFLNFDLSFYFTM